MEMQLTEKGWLLELKKMENVALDRARSVGSGRSYLYDSGNGLTCIVKIRRSAILKKYSVYWEINGRRIAKKDIIKCLNRLHKS